MSTSIWDAVTGITSIAGMVTAAYALWHTKRVDRRVHIQPYFLRKWQGIESQVRDLNSSLASWVSSVKQWPVDNYRVKAPSFPSAPTPEYLNFDWEYDRSARRILDQLVSLMMAASKATEEHNNLVHITSSSRTLVLKLQQIGAYDFQNDSEVDAREQAFSKYAQSICFRCLGQENGSISELIESEKYQTMISTSRQKLKELAAQVSALLPKLDKKRDEFSSLVVNK